MKSKLTEGQAKMTLKKYRLKLIKNIFKQFLNWCMTVSNIVCKHIILFLHNLILGFQRILKRKRNLTILTSTLISIELMFVCSSLGLRSQSTFFQLCLDGATASLVLPVLLASKVSCSRTQHVGRFQTPDLSLLSLTLYH